MVGGGQERGERHLTRPASARERYLAGVGLERNVPPVLDLGWTGGCSRKKREDQKKRRGSGKGKMDLLNHKEIQDMEK